jgi:hypothetical protein
MKKLFDLSIKRNFGEAVIFYLVYVVLLIVVRVLVAAFLKLMGESLPDIPVVTIIAVPLLGIAMLISKKQISNIFYIVLVVVATVLAYSMGTPLALIPLAYLSTR